jgi:integrase
VDIPAGKRNVASALHPDRSPGPLAYLQLGQSLRDQQRRALLLLGFARAFRRSELVALTLKDLAFVEEGLVVTLRRSKTDQEGAGLCKGIPRGEHLATCPVQALKAWLAATAIREGLVFRALDPHGRPLQRALPSYAVARLIKRLVAQVGLDPKAFGGHSLRAGLVTAAAQAGVGERIIMLQTGHSDLRSVRRSNRDGSLFRENAAAQVGL